MQIKTYLLYSDQESPKGQQHNSWIQHGKLLCRMAFQKLLRGDNSKARVFKGTKSPILSDLAKQ